MQIHQHGAIYDFQHLHHVLLERSRFPTLAQYLCGIEYKLAVLQPHILDESRTRYGFDRKNNPFCRIPCSNFPLDST